MTHTDSLKKARQSGSTMNYQAIIEGFLGMGIPADDIIPRENVFTFRAWQALGRVVKKGEHGVKVCTWVNTGEKAAQQAADTTKTAGRLMPRSTTVFHVSQTKEAEASNA